MPEAGRLRFHRGPAGLQDDSPLLEARPSDQVQRRYNQERSERPSVRSAWRVPSGTPADCSPLTR